MKIGKQVLSRALSSMELDSALESYLPIIEIAGNYRVYIENYKCIQNYADDVICICVKYGCIKIYGQSLLIVKVTTDSVSIDGIIESVQLETLV